MVDFKKVKNAKRTAKPDAPFGAPNNDEVFNLLIPEGAESGRIPAGDQYIGKLIGFVNHIAKSTGGKGYKATFTIDKGNFRGMDFDYYLPLSDNALWKIADVLTALGVPWEPGVPVTWRAKDLLGTLVRLVIKDDKDQNSRDVSKIAIVLPHPDGAGTKSTKKGITLLKGRDEDDEEDDDEDEDEDEETPAPRGRRKPPPPDEDEEEEEQEDEDDEEEDEPAPKKRKKVVAEEDDDEDDEDEDEWPEPPPSKPVRSKKKAETVPEDEDDEDEDEEEPPVRTRKKGPPVQERKVTKGKKRSRL